MLRVPPRTQDHAGGYVTMVSDVSIETVSLSTSTELDAQVNLVARRDSSSEAPWN